MHGVELNVAKSCCKEKIYITFNFNAKKAKSNFKLVQFVQSATVLLANG